MKLCTKCGILKDNSLFHKGRAQCKDCRKQIRHEQHLKNKEQENKLSRIYNKTHRKERRETERRYWHKIKLETFIAYSGNPPECACCHERNIEFLSIDHIEGNGLKHRKSLGYEGFGARFYLWLKKHGYPPGYRVLCYNCNLSRGFFGYCPHERK